MSELTPLDVRHVLFTTRFRGYDRGEVDRFLEEVAARFEEMTRERLELTERLAAAEERSEEARRKEALLSEAVVSAQSIVAEMKGQAQKEAALIVKEAELRAEELLRGGLDDLARIKRQIVEVREEKEEMIDRLRGILRMFDRNLSNLENEGGKEVKRGGLAIGGGSPKATPLGQS